MEILKRIKGNVWLIIGAVILFVAALFIRDLNQLEAIKSLFRRKATEDQVNEIKRKLATEQDNVNHNDDELARLAEDLKRKKVDVKKASDEDISKFYKDFFKK